MCIRDRYKFGRKNTSSPCSSINSCSPLVMHTCPLSEYIISQKSWLCLLYTSLRTTSNCSSVNGSLSLLYNPMCGFSGDGCSVTEFDDELSVSLSPIPVRHGSFSVISRVVRYSVFFSAPSLGKTALFFVIFRAKDCYKLFLAYLSVKLSKTSFDIYYVNHIDKYINWNYHFNVNIKCIFVKRR